MSITTAGRPTSSFPLNVRWKQQGETVAGGHGHGVALHQLAFPKGVILDENDTLFIADDGNHRIIA